MGGKGGVADGPGAPAAPGQDLVRYLAARESGLLRRAATRWSGGVDMAQELGEEKATLPVKNQVSRGLFDGSILCDDFQLIILKMSA